MWTKIFKKLEREDTNLNVNKNINAKYKNKY